VSLLTVNLNKSVASFCHQVAARVPDIFCNFCLVENHKIANDSTTAEAREKKRTDIEPLIVRNFMCYVSLNLKPIKFYLIKLATNF
jgi:hypothetical protein